MAKHSPGPWAVADHEHYPGLFAHIRGPSFLAQVCMFATDLSHEQVLQRRRDLQLMAAAPDLLEALAQAVVDLDIITGNPQWAESARRAIAKATTIQSPEGSDE